MWVEVRREFGELVTRRVPLEPGRGEARLDCRCNIPELMVDE